LALEQSLDKLDFNYLADCVENCKKTTDLIRSIGLDNYCKYRWVIQDLKEEMRQKDAYIRALNSVAPDLRRRLEQLTPEQFAWDLKYNDFKK
jgi:hypothetical protein